MPSLPLPPRLPGAPPSPPIPPGRPAERGAALIVGLIILGVMTLLGLSAMRGTALEERMAGNFRDQHDALQAAEAALQAALTYIRSSSEPPRKAPYGSRTPMIKGCRVSDPDRVTACTMGADVHSDWLSGADTAPSGAPFSDYANTAFGDDAEGSAWPQPRLIVVRRYVETPVQNNASKGLGVYYYTVSAIATGRSGKSRVVLQTTIRKAGW